MLDDGASVEKIMQYPKDGIVPRHTRLPIQRHLVGAPEALLIRKAKPRLISTPWTKAFLVPGVWKKVDMIQFVAGGHCFRCLEDTIFLEIKQGPYTGLVEQERF